MQTQDITKNIDARITGFLGTGTLGGFERAHSLAIAIGELKTMLTNEYMTPIMNLAGNKLGFRTDKDSKGGYTMEIVRNCLIEATLMGLQPCGNQFNIIAGNMYITKEGCGYLLNKYPGLKHQIIIGFPRINAEKTSAATEAKITWEINGATKTADIPIPIKIDQYASVDSIMGKATRKARAWLLSNITGIEIPEGDVEDAKTIQGNTSQKMSTADKELDRMKKLIEQCQTLEELDQLQKDNPDIDISLYKDHENYLKALK